MSRKRSERSKSHRAMIVFVMNSLSSITAQQVMLISTLTFALIFPASVVGVGPLNSSAEFVSNTSPNGSASNQALSQSLTVVTKPVLFGTQSQNRGDIRKLLEDYVAYIATMEHFDPTSSFTSSASSSISSLSPSESLQNHQQQSSLYHRVDSQHSSESRDRFIFHAAPSDHSINFTPSSSPQTLSQSPSSSGTFQETPTESALTLNLSDEELTTFIDDVLGASIHSEGTPTTTVPSSVVRDVSSTETEAPFTTDTPLVITHPSVASKSDLKRFERAQLTDVTNSARRNETSFLPNSKTAFEPELSDKFYTHDYDYGESDTNTSKAFSPEELFKLTEIDTEKSHKISPNKITLGDETGSNNFKTSLNSEDTGLLRELQKAKQLLQAKMDELRLTTTTTTTTTPAPAEVTTFDSVSTATGQAETSTTSPNFTTLTPFSENDLGLTTTTIEPETEPAPPRDVRQNVITTTLLPIPEQQITTSTPSSLIPTPKSLTQSGQKLPTALPEVVPEILNIENQSNSPGVGSSKTSELIVDTTNGTAETTILTHVPKITIIHKIKKPAGVRSRSDEDAIYREALKKHRELIKNTMSSISLVPAAFKRYKVHSDNNRVDSVGEIYLLPNFAQIQSQRSDAQILDPKRVSQEFDSNSGQLNNSRMQSFGQPEQQPQPQRQPQHQLENPKQQPQEQQQQQHQQSLQNLTTQNEQTTKFHSTIIKINPQERRTLNDIDRQLIGALEQAMKSSSNINSAESSLTSSLLTSPQSTTPISPRMTGFPIGTVSETRKLTANRNRFTYKRLFNKFNENAHFRGVNNFNLIDFENLNKHDQDAHESGEHTSEKVNNDSSSSNNNDRVRQYINFLNTFSIDDHPNPAHVIQLFRPRSKNTGGRKFKRIRIVKNAPNTSKALETHVRHHKRVVRVDKNDDQIHFGDKDITDKKIGDKSEIVTKKTPVDTRKIQAKAVSPTMTAQPEIKSKQTFPESVTIVSETSTPTPSFQIIDSTHVPKIISEKQSSVPHIRIKTTTLLLVSNDMPKSVPKLNVTQVAGNIVARNTNDTTSSTPIINHTPLKGFKIFCGYDASALWNNTSGVSFGIEELERNTHVLSTCTHLIYSFASINMNGELEIPATPEELARLQRLRQNHAPHLKIFVAIGGADTPPQLYSLLVATSKLRERLAANIHKFILDHEIDGVVVAWFYPVFGTLVSKTNTTTNVNRSARSTMGQSLFQIDDRANLVKFVKALRARFDSIPTRNKLEIGLFAPPFDDAIDKGYDLDKLNDFVDHEIVLTYDYFGPASPKVHHFAPLFPDSDNNNSERGQRLSINHTINHWLNKKPEIGNKTLLSLAFYGRTFTLASANNFTPGSKALGPGKPGPISSQPGLVYFNELCDLYLGHSNVRLIEDENKVTTYLKLFDQWVGFDDELSLYRKTKFAINRGLSGVFVWDLGLDDFCNRCGWGRFPLLMAVRKAVEHCQVALSSGVQC